MITEKHQAFARAVVALARQHKMDNLSLQFRYAIRMGMDELPRQNDMVTMTWSEGRHSVESSINMQMASHLSLPEKEPKHDPNR